MAYNVLKGSVEGSVDQHADQEIDGVKVFKNTLSASVFYNTDADSPCATLKDLPITTLNGGRMHAVLTYGLNRTVTANDDLTFDGTTLKTNTLRAEKVVGSAAAMSDIPHNKFTEPIRASDIKFGRGLKEVRGSLQVKGGSAIAVSEEGVGVDVGPTSGLAVRRDKLVIDPRQTTNIKTGGQNLSDNDLLLVADESRGSLVHTTLANFYDNYVNVKIPHPAGDIEAIQLKGKSGFTSSPNLSYDTVKNTLQIEGKTSTGTLDVQNTLTCHGAVVTNIKTITEENYEIGKEDYTVLCDSVENPMTILLPPASNHTGRILTIKKTNKQKYSLRSFPVTIKVKEGTIDISDNIILKMNYSSRILQSDGENWWVIGTKGT